MKNEVKKLLVDKAITAIKTEEPGISDKDLQKVLSSAYTMIYKQNKNASL
jgi:hypothetical protein